jgi:glycosyltransferase involved in cell wall biosynthesis
MKVFLSASSFKSSYGGPAYSVPRLGKELAMLGHEVGLWAPDESATEVDGAGTCMLLGGSLAAATSRFGRADVLHDNGVWLPNNHAVVKYASNQNIPIVVSPRGMLEPWALTQARWKKKTAWLVYQRRDLERVSILHATAESESINLKALLPSSRIETIPNGIDIPEAINLAVSGEENKTALYLSRLHPKKGILMLLAVWRELMPKGWRLRIIGPDKGGYRDLLKEQVVVLGLDEQVTVEPELLNQAKAEAYVHADLFVLPSYSENFGIVVSEALSYGVPVITTTGTPWRSLLENDCGWWVEPNQRGLKDALSKATNLTPEALRSMGVRGRDFVKTTFSWRQVAESFQRNYKKIL